MYRKIIPFAAAAILIVTWSCREQVVPESPDYTEYGWELMTLLEYRAALVQFEEGSLADPTYADAFNGLGWAYARLGVRDSSDDAFDDGDRLSDTTSVGVEILAGRAFAKLALGDSSAISDVRAVLDRDSGWIFSRDVTIHYEYLIGVAATAFYFSAEFDSALVWVQKLDPAFSADVATLQGRSELAAAIEGL